MGDLYPIKYVVPSVHPTQRSKLHLDRFCRFCIAQGRNSLYFTMGSPFTQNCPSHGASGPHLIHDALGPSKPTTQTASQWFSRFWATVCKTVCPMLSDRCLFCLSVCLSCLSVCPALSVTLVYCGQTVGWIKMKLGMQIGLDPGHIVLNGDPSPKGHSPQFSTHICCGQMAG